MNTTLINGTIIHVLIDPLLKLKNLIILKRIVINVNARINARIHSDLYQFSPVIIKDPNCFLRLEVLNISIQDNIKNVQKRGSNLYPNY